MKTYTGGAFLATGILLLLWFYFIKNDLSRYTPMFGFFAIALGARFLGNAARSRD